MSYRIAIAPFERMGESWLDDEIKSEADVLPVLKRWSKSSIGRPLRLHSDSDSPLLELVKMNLDLDYSYEASVWIEGVPR